MIVVSLKVSCDLCGHRRDSESDSAKAHARILFCGLIQTLNCRIIERFNAILTPKNRAGGPGPVISKRHTIENQTELTNAYRALAQSEQRF